MTEVLGIAYRDLNIFKAHFSTKGLFFFPNNWVFRGVYMPNHPWQKLWMVKACGFQSTHEVSHSRIQRY